MPTSRTAYLAGLPLLAYSLACLTLFCTQDRLVFRPSRTPGRTPQDLGLEYEDLYLLTHDGLRLHAWSIEHASARGWILYCHGNSDNLGSRVDLARFVHDAGYNLLIFDYRGYGHSEGQPSEHGLYADAWCAWQHLRQDRCVDAQHIVVVGDSLGGAVAAALAERETPAGLILAATFTSMPELARELYPYLPMNWICRHKFETRHRIGRIPCPKLILHSPNDELIASHHGQRLFEAARHPREWCELEGLHARPLGAQPPTSRQAILDFVARALQGSSPSHTRQAPPIRFQGSLLPDAGSDLNFLRGETTMGPPNLRPSYPVPAPEASLEGQDRSNQPEPGPFLRQESSRVADAHALPSRPEI